METSNQVQHLLRSSWSGDRRYPAQAPYRSELVFSAGPLRRHRGTLRCVTVNRHRYFDAATQIKPGGSVAATTNYRQRPWNPVLARKKLVKASGGLAAWQKIVIAAFIEKHIGKSLTVRALARFVYLSPYCFSRAFKQSFGISPHRYLVRQRTERAKILLSGSVLSANEIGLALGFSKTSSFSAAFQKVTGVTPTEYRQILR